MTQNALWQLFRQRYGLIAQPALALVDYKSESRQDGQLHLQATLLLQGTQRKIEVWVMDCCLPPPAH